MRILRLTTLACAFFVLCLVVKAEEGVLYSSNQLTSTLITSLTQDRQGFIWIGTQNGLNRFDGYRFTPYLFKKGNTRSLCHNHVSTLYVERSGRLWVGTGKGLAYYDERTDDFQRIDLLPDSDNEPNIACLAEAKDGTLLIGTSGYGLYEIKRGEQKAKQVHRFEVGKDTNHYPTLLVDSLGRLWRTGIDHQIYCFSSVTDPKPRLLFSQSLESILPDNLLQGEKGDILVHGSLGFAVFNRGQFNPVVVPTEGFTLSSMATTKGRELLVGTSASGLWRYPADINVPERVNIPNRVMDFSTANVTTVMEDRQQNLWIGIAQRGLLFIGRRQLPFHNMSLLSQGIKTGGVISSVCQSSAHDGSVWCAVRGGDLYRFNASGLLAQTVQAPKELGLVWRDSQGQVWLSAGRSIYSFDEASGRSVLRKTFDCAFIMALGDDGKGNVYVSTFGKGMAIYDTHSGQTRHFSMFMKEESRGRLCNDWVMNFLVDGQGLLWIATSSGVSCYDPAKDSFKPLGWHNLLEGYACLSLVEDKKGGILIGTDRGLFRYDRQTNKTVPFPSEDSELDDKVIMGMVCDPNGDVWCSTSMGIWHYRQHDGELIGHMSDNGLREREYILGIAEQTHDGRIVFGNNDGLVAFNPADLNGRHQELGDVVLTSLLIGSEAVSTQTRSNGSIVTTEPVWESNYFTLSYLDNSFTLHFSTFDFANAQNLKLEYRLNDDYWTQTTNGAGSISFNRLQPGTYRLYVRAVGGDVSSPVRAYTITIVAPWYRSTIAYLVYLLALLALVGYVVWRFWRSRQQQLAEEKMQFLINATHDIRTPLTLILSPLHKAMNIVKAEGAANSKLSTLNSQLETIDHNARRILGLVNQILDIRKIDKQQMRLSCQETELVPFISHIQKVFAPHAQERHISFTFEHSKDITAWIDRTQFDKVIQNLLSNAFKFTPDEGNITIDLQADESRLTITVTDTGTGLHEADIPKLFTRFYQSTSNQALGKEGTGIGLNLCKMIVEMHHGTISAQNRTDGVQGSQFIVTLPLGNSHLSSEEIMVKSEEQTDVQEVKKATGHRHRILLVDDDAEITDYIASELSDQYRFQACLNGKEALHELLSDDKHYDLVVSDIMMPEMDGFTLLRTIKANTKLSHLPVILLTSESAVGNRLEGLQRGADAFLAKPFLLDELQATIDNLLAKSVRLKDKFSGAEEDRKEQVEQRDIADNDKQLMDRIMQSVNKNLSDSDFSVEQLAADAGLSRSQLHRRMKELTGITPSDFIRNLRLEQAARLLRERKANISQVAYTLGFNTPGNFSKAFKQHFGMSPTEYIGNND